MKVFLITMICFFGLGIIADIINLGKHQYPRKRKDVDAGIDVFSLLLYIGAIIWIVNLLIKL